MKQVRYYMHKIVHTHCIILVSKELLGITFIVKCIYDAYNQA